MPDQIVLLGEASDQSKKALAIFVTSKESSLFAQGFRDAIDKRIKELDEQRKEITRPLDAAKAAIMKLFNAPIIALDDVKRSVDKKILEFVEEQDRLVRLAQKKLDDDAEKKRKSDMEIAERAAAKGDDKKAQKFAERAESHVSPLLVSEPARAKGTGFRVVWKFRIKDRTKVTLMIPDEPKIGDLVRKLQKDAQPFVGEGVEIYSERIIAGSRS